LGKRALEATLPEREDDVNTRRGSKIHAALEKSDLSGLSTSDEITASRCMFAEGEIVQKYNFEGSAVAWERRVWDVDDNFKPLWSVKIDATHIHPTKPRALTGDYKTGYSTTIPIEKNWQVKAEAAAAALENPVEEVVSALIHPHHPDSLYEVTVFDRVALAANLISIRLNVAAIQMPGQPRTPNAISCQYCQAKGICPEYKALQTTLIQAAQMETKERGWTLIHDRTPDERGEHIKALKMAEADIKELLARYAKFAEGSPAAITGWTLRRSWDRRITNETEALKLTLKHFGNTAAAAATRFSLAKLEEYLKRQMKADEAKERVERVLFTLINRKPKEAYLVEKRS
jgi:hypothetical protein